MSEKRRVLIQMSYTRQLMTAMSAARLEPSNDVPTLDVRGVSLDEGFTPVKLPKKSPRESVEAMEVGRLFAYDAGVERSTYLIRGEVEDDASLDRLVKRVEEDPNGVGVFSDPKISAIAVCPQNPVRNYEYVANLLETSKLSSKGMDGSNVMVAVVDTGVNLGYLNSKGKNPGFDAGKSWTPVSGLTPGNMPVDHGTMCAFDVCISAPNCTLLDYALLRSQAGGGSAMDGFLSDAIKAYSKLLDLLSTGEEDKPALVVNNSWGMFHPSWDFLVGHPGNYSDNPDHPFNIIVESLEDAGADILFAAGNCGPECPDGRCEGVTDKAIYGANSHSSVLCVAGVTANKVRLGYSSQGPGRLQQDKPDICAYSHFEGSGVYNADGGTSAACPVAAGVVAAIRSVHSPDNVSPAQLRNLIRRTSEDLGLAGFDYGHGHGLINVSGLINALERKEVSELKVGELVSGNLKESGDSIMYRIVGSNLNIVLDGPQGADFDVYVKKGAPPTTADYDSRGYTGSADERVRVENIELDEFYVMVRSYRGSGEFSIMAELE